MLYKRVVGNVRNPCAALPGPPLYQCMLALAAVVMRVLCTCGVRRGTFRNYQHFN